MHHAQFLADILGLSVDGDPACQEIGQIYRSKHTMGRRGAYFRDPDGHLMEILTPGGAGA
ncbi:hypothetical protein [Streptomyces sp. NPDC020298]|uniref:hypothetical protein n=1 Tax=unclassified Streptomyces TaxID=2593676 RepID=UPI0034093098